jgi:hypothetical protein
MEHGCSLLVDQMSFDQHSQLGMMCMQLSVCQGVSLCLCIPRHSLLFISVLPAGAEFRHYTADITRTFPASRKFTAQQRDSECKSTYACAGGAWQQS